MNKTYRLVWNAALRLWQVSAELTRSHRKGGRQRRGVSVLSAATLFLASVSAWSSDLPTGGTVTAGVGAIDRSGATMTITQGSERMAIDWRSFSIGEDATVRFVQPGAQSAALNRVLGPDASKILGSLEANGQVFLVNPNGVLFGNGAQVNVGGLVASTLDIATEDFLAGEYRFAGDSNNSVINRGDLRANNGGFVALIAARVENAGQIRADGGDVLLGAGRKVRLDLGGPVQLEIEEAALDALIEQRGAIRADGGRVLLTAKAAANLASTVINHSGIIEARRLEAGDDGEIVLSGAGGEVAVSGTLDVSSVASNGGKAVVTGDTVQLAESAHINARGAAGGGEIYVGGGWQGKNAAISNALATTLAQGASLDASSTSRGDGGTVVVWADADTRFAGSIAARGSETGNGGQVEVSGKQTLAFSGDVDTGGGRLLLDPPTITIQNVAGDLVNTFSTVQLRTLLSSNDVTLLADDGITWNADATLTYNELGARALALNVTDGDLIFSGVIHDSSVGDDALSVALNAGGSGGVYAYGSIDAGDGGNIAISAGGRAQVDGLLATRGAGNIDIYTETLGVEFNRGIAQVENGTLSVNGASNLVAIWGGEYIATGSGNIALTSRTGGIYLGGSTAMSHGWLRAGSGDVSFTANAIQFQNVNTGISGSGALLLQPYDTDYDIHIGTGSVSGALSLNTSHLANRVADGFSQITIGRAAGGGTITVGNIGFHDDVTLRGHDINLNGALSAGRVTLTGTGGEISQGAGAALTADELLFAGVGSFDLFAGTNTVGTFAADIDGSLRFRNSGALTIGSVDTTHGILATGTLDIATQTGNLTVNRAIGTSDISASAVTLNAGRGTAAGTTTGGNILLGIPDAISVGAGGRATLYTGSIDDSVGVSDAAGSGHFRYGSDETTTNYTAALGTGTYAIYREQPTLRYVAGNASGQYGDAPDLSDVSHTIVSGYRGDDNIYDTITSPDTFATTATATSNVDTYAITYTGDVASALGYALEASGTGNGQFSVTRRVLDLTGVREYDGSVNFDAGRLALNNLANGDTLMLTGVGTVVDANVGTGRNVTLGTLALGDDSGSASNYTLAGGTHSAEITRRQLTLGGSFSIGDKSYDGTTAATITDSSILSLVGLASGEDLSLTSLIAAFADQDVGIGRTASLTAAALADGANGEASNYSLSLAGAPTTSADINRRQLTLSGVFTADGKVYDGSAAATLLDTSGVTLAGVVGGEDLNLTSLAGAFVDQNAGTGKIVSLTAATLADGANGAASNYTLSLAGAPTTTADITPKDLTVTANDRTASYDGAVYDGGFSVSYAGFITGEDESVLGGALAFGGESRSARNAGDYSIEASGLVAGNYAIDYVDGVLTIDPALLTISTSDVIKTYDATNAANGTAIAIGGTQLFGSDSLSGGDFAFLDPNAGTDKTVTVGNVTVNDGNGGANYRISYAENTTSTIERAQLIVTADDRTATYDGEQYAGGFSASFSGFVANEDASALDGELAFAGDSLTAVDPGEYEITVDGLTSGNYSIQYESGVLRIEGEPEDREEEIPTEVDVPREVDLRAATAQHSMLALTSNMAGTSSGGGQPGVGGAFASGADTGTAQPGLLFIAAEDAGQVDTSQTRASGQVPVVVIEGGIRMPFQAVAE